MDPHQNLPMPNPEFSQPVTETKADDQPEAEQQQYQAEKASVSAELPLTSPIPTSTTTQTSPITPPSAQPAAPVSQSVISVDAPAIAEDNDLIEQEWVNKAKEIVDRTSEDPYEQNKEINKFKADYIKKRYKREIKVNEA